MKTDVKSVWERIYWEWFKIKKDFSFLQLPTCYNSQKHFVVIVSQELTLNRTVIALKEKFKIHLFDENLDSLVIRNDRTAEQGDYIVLFNRNIEADEEFKNFSANQLDEINHQGITLLERLLLEIIYFDNAKKHLDNYSWTLCTGSRYSNGSVPNVGWDSHRKKFFIYWYRLDYSGENLRSRVVAC